MIMAHPPYLRPMCSAQEIYTKALQTYFERFDFVHDPLDIAMRKLLMHVDLPRETQQIDRVIEAFARRYLDCNPDLFISEGGFFALFNTPARRLRQHQDHPYILAFSLMMLHTDAFNKSNKRKMMKGDYVKNTRLPGVAPEALEVFDDASGG
jgi:Sec7-like guanine-nucleotide exchange factor